MTAPTPTMTQPAGVPSAGGALPYGDAVPGAVLEQLKTGLVVAPDRVVELARYSARPAGVRLLLDGDQH